MFDLSPDRLLNLLDVATEAALAGGAVLESFLADREQLTASIQEKGRSGDLVTVADRSAEAAVIAVLQRLGAQLAPEIGILAEESGRMAASQSNSGNESEALWAIDPLDGTTNFAHAYPFACVSIGLVVGGQPVLGVVYDPFRRELFRAAQGLGATRNRQPIHVSAIDQLSRSLLVTGFAYDRRTTTDNNYREFCYLTHLTQGVRRGGSAAIDLAYVACGRLDGYWERGLSLWDIAAGIVLIQEAGGQVTAYDGGPVDAASGRLVGTNGKLHEPLIQALQTVPPLATWSQDPSTWPIVG